jgi:hypothetical protein
LTILFDYDLLNYPNAEAADTVVGPVLRWVGNTEGKFGTMRKPILLGIGSVSYYPYIDTPLYCGFFEFAAIDSTFEYPRPSVYRPYAYSSDRPVSVNHAARTLYYGIL